MRVRSFNIIGLIVLIVIQLSLLIFISNTKKSYYIDDLWSFEISQGSFDYIYPEYAEKWNEREELKSKIKIDKNEKFNFGKVRAAVEKDSVHPPFYYYLLNFLGSVFNKISLDAIANVINIILSLCVTVVLFCLTRKAGFRNKNIEENENSNANSISNSISKDKILVLVPSIIWVFLAGSMRVFMLYRMYILLIFISLALLLIVLKVNERIRDDEKVSIKYFTLIAILLWVGFLTHFYFALYSFVLVALTILTLLVRKRFLDFIKMVITAIIALLLSILIYPKLLYFMFFSYQARNVGVNINDLNPINFFHKLAYTAKILLLNIFPNIVINTTVLMFLMLAIIIILIVFFFRSVIRDRHEENTNIFNALIIKIRNFFMSIYSENIFLIIIPFLTLYVFLSATYVVVVSRYISIVFPLVIFTLALLISKCFQIIEKPLYKKIVVGFIIVILSINSIFFIPFEYPETDKRIKAFYNLPAIVILKSEKIYSENATYSMEIQSLLGVLKNFKAEMHAREDLFVNNIFGMNKEAAIKADFNIYGMKFEKTKMGNLAKGFTKYNKNSLVLFIENKTKVTRKEILLIVKKGLGFKTYSSLGDVTHWGKKFYVYRFMSANKSK